jgi:hypothetical protein
MAEPTLLEIFGTGATQDANTLTIQKSVLTAVGLTASADNKAERLLAAIVKLAALHLTQANFDANIDQSILMSLGLPSTTIRGTESTAYNIVPLTIEFSKPAPAVAIVPDDY